MTKERLLQIRASKQEAYQRQFDNYQNGGPSKCLTNAKGYEEIVDICDMALSSADDHSKALTCSMNLIELGRLADRVIMNGWQKTFVEALVKTAKDYAKKNGYNSPYDSGTFK